MQKKNLLLLSLFLLTPITAFAGFEFSPISLSIGSSGTAAIGTFTVKNTSDTKVPVQIYIVPREPDINGKEVYIESEQIEDLFAIFPNQAVISPNDKKSIRVTWKGDPNIKKERAFRVIAEEMPFDVEDPEKKSSSKPVGAVRISSKYIGSIYVAPNGVEPKLVFTGEPSSDSKQLVLDVENQGTAHQIIQKIKLNVQSSKTGATAQIKEEDVRVIYNQNILASKKRRFIVPWPFGFPIGPLKVSFELLK